MHNLFAPYEQDFNAWWASREFPQVSAQTRDFLSHLTRPDAPRRLWRHQEEALMRAVYAYELLGWDELLLNIVTGGGKTAVIGAAIAWLRLCHDLHKFLLLCPNTIVRDRLEDDFKGEKIFRDFGFFPEGSEHYLKELTLHVMETKVGPQGIRDHGDRITVLRRGKVSGEFNAAEAGLDVISAAITPPREARTKPSAERAATAAPVKVVLRA